MHDAVERALQQEVAIFDEIDLILEVPKHRFWGGNIVIGDLLTVDDYIVHIQEHGRRQGRAPDLVLVPTTGFNAWGRDIRGEPYLKIKRVTGVPVELVDHPRY